MSWKVRSEIHLGPDGHVRGLWWFYGTHGVPLAEQCSLLSDRGLCPDWPYLCIELAGNGWNDKRIYSYIVGEIEGVYSPDVAGTIRRGLARLLHQEAA